MTTTCVCGKQNHVSMQAAKKVVRYKRNLGVKMRPYRCRMSGYWHVGNGLRSFSTRGQQQIPSV